jgi:hypothetical protein
MLLVMHHTSAVAVGHFQQHLSKDEAALSPGHTVPDIPPITISD